MSRPARAAAVLVPIFRDGDGALRLVIVRRAPGGSHGGQLAFPGGMPEPGDGSLLATAVREAHEEIGLPAERVRLLERLPVVETLHGLDIHPFLGRIEPPAAWIPAPDEVAEVIVARVTDLALPESHGESLETFPGSPMPQTIAFYRVGPHRLWGASYRILRPLLPRLVAGEWGG